MSRIGCLYEACLKVEDTQPYSDEHVLTVVHVYHVIGCFEDLSRIIIFAGYRSIADDDH